LFQKLFDLLEDTVLKFNEFVSTTIISRNWRLKNIELQRKNLKIRIDEVSQEVINSVKEKKKHFARESNKVVNVKELKGMIERKKENSLENFRQLKHSTVAIEAMQVDLNENLNDTILFLIEFRHSLCLKILSYSMSFFSYPSRSEMTLSHSN